MAVVTDLREDEATEAEVRQQAPRHRYLHFATHGFFAPKELRSALTAASRGKDGDAANLFGGRKGVAGFHPGLLSGLVLAGANRPAEVGKDDGILTALEVESLDLGGVELAVLSACETGLGEKAGGEGLLGLQRAFQVAGCAQRGGRPVAGGRQGHARSDDALLREPVEEEAAQTGGAASGADYGCSRKGPDAA